MMASFDTKIICNTKLEAGILLGTPLFSELLFNKLTLMYTPLESKEGWIHGGNFPV